MKLKYFFIIILLVAIFGFSVKSKNDSINIDQPSQIQIEKKEVIGLMMEDRNQFE